MNLKEIRRINREIAIQYLYSQDLNPSEDDLYKTEVLLEEYFQAISHVNSYTVELNDLGYAHEIVGSYINNKEDIDTLITKHLSESNSISEVPTLDRNILRISLSELLHKAMPPAIVINEAVEISKKYSSEHAGKFINGVLDKIVKNHIKQGK